MKNLIPLNCVQINEFDLIKDSKAQPRRRRLGVLRPRINANYIDYEGNFGNIHAIGNIGYSVAESEDLLHCYKPTVALSNLKKRIVDLQQTEYQHICGYCLYHKISTFDHYIPIEEFPVYSSMPLNLVPCCSSCNSTKNNYWRNNGSRLFIHLYKDLIPNAIFLTATLNYVNNIPVISFTLNHPANISLQEFSLIEAHFTRLDLLKLYGKNTPLVISDIRTDVKIQRELTGVAITQAQITALLRVKANNLKVIYGNNYWYALAIETLSNSNQFIGTL